MKFKGASLASVFLVIVISACMIFPRSAYNAILYKSYTIRYDRGWDILCDPYVVKKNDWLYKLFRQKGEISHRDFPEFLRIFKRINQHIHNIDRIRAGQHIIIPLKKLKQSSMPGQSSGVVTIPFVTIPNLPETFKTYAAEYTVQKGDCLSILISTRFGPYGAEPYKQGIKLFKLINPDIKDLNRIYAGQDILIPDPAIQKQPWYQSLFDRLANNQNLTDFDPTIKAHKKTPMLPVPEDMEKKPSFPLSKVACALDAKLSTKGVYYFPRQGQEDFKIDLSRIPLIELKNGTRILFPMDDNKNKKSELDIVKSFWKDVHIVQIVPNDSEKHVFDAVFERLGKGVLKNRLSFFDQGVKVEVRGEWIFDKIAENGKSVRHFCISLIDNPRERTPKSILRYLDQNNIALKEILTGENIAEQKSNRPGPHKSGEIVSTIDSSDQKIFVNDLITALGYNYLSNVSISFPYSGVQVNTVSNLFTGSDGNPYLVDFGDLYGDAVSAIEKTGFTVIQIKGDDNYPVIIHKILGAMNVSYTNNPTFLAAKRPAIHNTVLTIPGFLVTGAGKPGILLSFSILNNGVIQFLTNQGVKISMIQPSKKVTQHIN
ncbi:MAG: LysM peptidoglycan-binding domain-containing protein [Deltaproteobacteria bacterium]|nr:LysM peptidoglycan-binding domain-containing protein [Deltaproteobacteria bacterium]